MNDAINQETNLTLMKQVERAVRPIPAGRKRKLQMREELLAHLTAIYQEELPRQPDEAAALTAAFERFGSPAEIAAELSRGVTWKQRLDYFEEQTGRFFGRWIALRSEDSLLRYSGRALVLIAMIVGFHLTIYLALLWMLETAHDPLLLPLTVKLVLHSVASLLCYFWAVRGVERNCLGSIQGGQWGLAAATVLIWLAVFTGLSCTAWYLITGDIRECVARVPRFTVANMLFAMPATFFTAWLLGEAKRKSKPYEVWTKLELED